MLSGLPTAERDVDTAPFWEGCDSGELRLPSCADCETPRWPPGPCCPACGSAKTRWRTASGDGVVHSWVVVHVPLDPALADQIPYAVGLVELAEGVRIVSTIEAPELDAIEAGMPLRVRFDECDGGGRLPVFTTSGGER